ncbi:transglutaminase TgpA family protein [Sinomonas sp. B1-1]|uniref:transglutaminase TgpA family protein n=1 Tax=Sinomonas sp. B1-1 TaxID=3141454 RepID=UPI003D294621
MRARRFAHLGVEAFLALSVAGGAASYGGVLRGFGWLYPVIVVTCAALAGTALARAALAGRRGAPWHPVVVAVAGLAAWVAAMCAMFFRATSFAGFIPGPRTIASAHEALDQAWHTVVFDAVPAAPNVGIVALLAGALGLIALVAETIAISCRLPALAGIALLAVLVVPATLKPNSVGAVGFAAAAAGYLGILATAQADGGRPDGGGPEGRRSRQEPTRGARAPERSPGELAAAALSPGRLIILIAAIVAGALALPQVVPGFDRGLFPEGARLRSFGQNVGLNPLISLGSDLRSAEGVGILRYATNSTIPLYLRTVTVSTFDGGSWAPDNRDDQLQYPLTGITPRTPITAAPSVTTTTVITTGGFTSPYLPAPYAPTTVDGQRGRFGWDPADLSIKGDPGASRDQFYTVRSTRPDITRDALATANGTPRGLSSEVRDVPRGVPASVRSAAEDVTRGKATAFERAVAIQAWLRTFQYSERAPVEDGYDGTGMDVLETFLQKRSGYCIHFAAAMAVMARIVGIPSRIAVGFAPGRPTGQTVAIPSAQALTEYQVDGRDAHAWPELYFEGLGWVPFEPTPSRGVTPAYSLTDSAAQSGSTNLDQLNEGLFPSGVPGAPPAESQASAPAASGASTEASPWVAAALVALGVLAAALVLTLPAALRAAQRRRRLDRGLDGIWEELEAVGVDHGLPPDPADSPRAYAKRLTAWETDDGGLRRALDTLTAEYERHAFGRPGYDADEEAARRAVAVVHETARHAQRPVRRARIAALPPSAFAWLARALTAVAPAAKAAGATVRAAAKAAARWVRRRR